MLRSTVKTLLLVLPIVTAACGSETTAPTPVAPAPSVTPLPIDGVITSTTPIPTITANRGTGVVAKGDVQSTFRWNNGDLQANAASVTFRLAEVVTERVSYRCAAGGAPMSATVTTTLTQAYKTSARLNPNGMVLGWELKGFDGETAAVAAGTPSCSTGSLEYVGTAAETGRTAELQVKHAASAWTKLNIGG